MARVLSADEPTAPTPAATRRRSVVSGPTELRAVPRHTMMDLVIQKVLGVAFAVMALPLLCIAFWPRTKKALPPPPPLPPPALPT